MAIKINNSNITNIKINGIFIGQAKINGNFIFNLVDELLLTYTNYVLSLNFETKGIYDVYYANDNTVLDDYEKICTIDLSTNTMASYDYFNNYNIAPVDATEIVLCKQSTTEIVATASIPSSLKVNVEEKLFSFSAVSDLHHHYSNEYGAQHDVPLMYQFIENTNSEFICCCGDVTTSANGSNTSNIATELEEFANYKNTYSTKILYACKGNHDYNISEDDWISYVGYEQNYYFEKGDYLFVFMSLDYSDNYATATIDWLEDVISDNSDKKILLFMHFPLPDYAGLPDGTYYGFTEGDSKAERIIQMLENNSNIIIFSGHSHYEFKTQENEKKIKTYNRTISIPSVSLPRDYNGDYYEDDTHSEGFIVDVYNNGLMLKGVSFINNKYLPLANYFIEI